MVAKPKNEGCELQHNEDMRLEFERLYTKMSSDIMELKLSKPALRALIRLDIWSLSDLKGVSYEILSNAHGIGPNALKKLFP